MSFLVILYRFHLYLIYVYRRSRFYLLRFVQEMIKGVFKKMSKKKYYVVWSGKKTGIFESWEACRAQVDGFPGARFKSFSSKEEAEAAYAQGPQAASSKPKVSYQSDYIAESISVDAACSGNPGDMEYRGVYTKTGEEIFHYGPVANGTNNIGEFLAIVHALALLKQKNSAMPIYSDSMTAIGWVKKKQVHTTIPRDHTTEHLWNLIDRALRWLEQHSYPNQILKWDTKSWGESKADFGRK